ncbi:MAG: helix-turn-helix domain-containing protein [Magnetococcales bacterium]|nr:helix-turn-helix domain-containing protein [Magnetococcales bacterium]
METIECIITPVCTDWHPLDIQCALRKRGWSLSRLSETHGYERHAAIKTLRFPWLQIEWIIAETLGRKPWEIWPSRYPNGPTSKPERGEKRRRNAQQTGDSA